FAVVDLDVGGADGRADDEVFEPVAVHVTHRHRDPTEVGGGEGREFDHQRAVTDLANLHSIWRAAQGKKLAGPDHLGQSRGRARGEIRIATVFGTQRMDTGGQGGGREGGRSVGEVDRLTQWCAAVEKGDRAARRERGSGRAGGDRGGDGDGLARADRAERTG